MHPLTLRALISASLSEIIACVTFEQVDAVNGVAVEDSMEQQVVALELGQLYFIH